ncbi:MAG: LysM peptidoglycan-binding domain-containing protein [Flavobacteriales bacterium]|nr:MAG: LysM peptidoglycan-binding domain-containing protein [Flavobacteriales bacterium]
MAMFRQFVAVILFAPFAIFAQSFDSIKDAEFANIDSIYPTQFVFDDLPFAQLLDSIIWYDMHGSEGMELLLAADSIVPATGMDSIIAARIAALDAQTPFELRYNSDVHRFIQMYLRKHEMVSRMLGLADFYFPLFEEVLDRNDMPLELKYLSVVESALNSRARSRVGAQGLWQFMYNTGKMMGLDINSLVDERNDPYKSTEAACAYLAKMYNWFGDWNMALAAYNAGPGNVNKAIRRSGGKKTYWEIRPFLPKETQGYVPAFIAVNYIMHYAADHGISPTPAMYTYFQVDTVEVQETLTFELLSDVLKIPIDQLEALNPMYRKNIIPASKEAYNTLVLPFPHMGVFLANEDSIYRLANVAISPKVQEVTAQQVDQKIHRVSSGENLSTIASKHRVSVAQIKTWNNLRNDRIYVGQRLQIQAPTAGPPSNQGASMSTNKIVEKSPGSDFVLHRVQLGDTLYGIASKYPGISAEDIMRWNDISNPQGLRTGEQLKIHVQ